ncbi:uncharacterized protein K441DRAFT_656982, partial [Cenococcum geophilum 1.58]|uniref:uncharacterized protein n=1 Tax=Cenococcum geophilum 1.58 TaxID=794803 RepID=UPI00358F05D7
STSITAHMATAQMTTSNTDQNVYLGYRSNDYPEHRLNDCLECRSKHHTWIKRFSRASYKGC